MSPSRNASSSPATSSSSSCLTKPARNFRVHPQCKSVVNPAPTPLPENGGVSTSSPPPPPPPPPPQINPNNWTVARTSLTNMSKRFRNKNKVGIPSHLTFSDDVNNNLNLPPQQQRRSSSRASSRLRYPNIFASRGTLCEEQEEQSCPLVLKSCLKKSTDSIDKFLCKSSANCETAGTGSCLSLGGSGGTGGFRKFITLATTIICLVVIFVPSIVVGDEARGSGIYEDSSKQDFIQLLRKKLTKDEIVSIFGRRNGIDESDFNDVPNFDIIQPKMTLHRKARGKRSPDLSSSTTLIQLQGLGRTFHLRVTPNQNLLDPHFVFLKRNQNQSEIMPDFHVRKEIPCFYQGKGQHFRNGDDLNSSRRVDASVALSLCGGLKGFILPTSIQPDDDDLDGSTTTPNDDSNYSNHHYVIHPIPTRFHNSFTNSTQRKKDDDQRDENEHERHHFLFRLTSPPQNTPKNNLDSPQNDASCGHKHDKVLSRKPRSASPDNPFGGSNLDPFDSYWFHQYQQPTRSNLFTHPSSVFPSSYWGPKSSSEQRGSSSPFSPGITGAANIGLTFARRNYYEVDDPRDHEGSATNKGDDWSVRRRKSDDDDQRVLLYESTADGAGASSEDEPDTILPFYTKGRKKSGSRSTKVLKTSTRWIPTSGEMQRQNQNYSESNSWSKYNRKGRRDENYFGADYKSHPLDDTDRIFSEKRGRYDNSESNSIYSRETTASMDNKNSLNVDKPPSQLTIETAVFVDKDLFKHMQSNFPDDTHGEVVRIVLAMINAVQLLYQDPSLGHRVDFVLKRLEVLETDPPGLLRPYDIDRFLTNFCKWQKTENPPSDADPLHWDHALILTGLDLYVVHQSGKISNQVVGLAPVAGMCTRSSSCTVNEGRHFESVFVISHEIGHNLGMRHDGPQADNDCDPTSHIMSPTLGSGKITWSPCSRKYLDMFLETSQSKCLLDKGKSELRLDHDADGRLPGERFDADRQCVLKYGRGSFHATQQPLEDVCRDLHCRREHYTWTSHPALEGTYCGSDMWCRSGKCVGKSTYNHYPVQTDHAHESGRNGDFIQSNHLPGSETAAYSVQKAVDGVWGQWSLFTDCSSACLYSEDGSLTMGSTGVRLAARRCDSPRPENGGRQCSGPDRRYKTCSNSKVSKICSANVARTTISQYANDVCNRAATADNELTGAGFMMSTNDAERACSVWCETLDNGVPRSRGWSFPDGTGCQLISQSKAQRYCVAGKCQDFACNPYSFYALSDEECSFTASNEVTPQSSWYTSSSLDSESGGKFPSLRIGKTAGWTDWESHSECKLPCLAPAKGLELVKRRCSSGSDSGADSCTGLALSVKLCKPDKTTILRNGCTRLQTPFEYATKVCSKYAEKIQGLSGIGMQLSPTKDDKDRPCRIGCQDVSIPYRFYMVNGEDGWFPAGTDCSRGEPDKKAFCITGKCVDFGTDDTPVYRITNKLIGKIETLFQPRSKRQTTSYNIMEPLRVPSTMDESSLRDLVHKFSQQTGNFPSITSAIRRSNSVPLDFTRPILTQTYSRDYYSPKSFRSANPIANSWSRYANSRAPDSQFRSRSGQSVEHKGRSGGGGDAVGMRGRSLNLDHVQLGDSSEEVLRGSKTGKIIDFDNNLLESNIPIEGSYYEWRKIVSDCSVSCGNGIQEVIVECVSGDTVVSDSFCSARPRPGRSGYVDCRRTACSSARRSEGGHIWNWLQSALANNSSTPTPKS